MQEMRKILILNLKSKVEALQAEGMQKMIIDLRDNPGGALDVACNIADMIVPEGLITYIEYKDGERQDFESDANEMDIPIVILIMKIARLHQRFSPDA